MYIQPQITLIHLMSEDVITASFQQTTIQKGDYAENKDEISFEELIG